MTALGTRWPARPIFDAIGHVTATEWAERTGMSLRRAQEHITKGVPQASADRVAIRFGLHPAMVWPVEWAALPDRPDRI